MTVDLHVAKTLEELNKIAKANINKNCYKNARVHVLRKAAMSIYSKIAQVPDDDEHTYIFAYRYLKLLDIIYTKEQDKHFLQTQFDRPRQQVQEILNKVKDILNKRYAVAVVHKCPIKKNIEDVPEKNENIFGTDDNFLNAKQFYKGLQETRHDILIMDVRPSSSFSESKLQGDFCLINFDDYEIEKGISANKFEEKLIGNAKNLFAKRNTFEYIVLMDLNSTKESFPTSKVKVLYDMLTIWDINTNYKRSPFVLNGGYIDFIDIYPSLSTNPVISFQRYNDLDELLDLDEVVYPPLEKEQELLPETPDDATVAENLFEEIYLTTVRLLQLEEELYNKEVDLHDARNGNKTRLEDLLKEKSELEDKKRNNNEHKLILLKEIKLATLKLNDANYLKRPDLTNIERSIVEVSRKRRKLTEGPKGGEMTVKDETMMLDKDTSSGRSPPPSPPEEIKKIVLTKPKPANIMVPRPLDTSHKVTPPAINRATKPFQIISTSLGLNGLVNIRNSCYMNSVLQCLRHIPALKNYFVSGQYKNELTAKNPKVTLHIGDLFERMWVGTNRTIRPQEFYNRVVELHPVFGKGHHEDANEFYMLIYGYMTDDTSREIVIDKYWPQQRSSFFAGMMNKRSFLSEQFYYQIRADCTCSGCKRHVHKYDIENILILTPPTSERTTMQKMLTEYLTKCDMNVYCKDCERIPDITKKVTYQPRILTVMFKRYHSDSDGIIKKIYSSCGFPITDFKFGNAYYNLWAICLHSGTMNAGHYTAACLNSVDSKWYEFNDETVQQIDPRSSSLESAAYMLFYQITDERLVGFQR